jgi:hypothetical protein
MIKNKVGAAFKLNPHQEKSNLIITQKEELIKILTYGKPKVVGKILYRDDKTVFSKQVKESEHLFRNFNAWGFQEEILPKLSKKNITDIEVKETEKAITYKTSLTTILKNGIRKDYGHGLQVFLPLKYWSKVNEGNSQLSLLDGEKNV